MTDDLILVLGPHGTTGRRVVARLHDEGATLRGASRRGEPPFDWSDPTTWEPVVAGAQRMYLMAPHEQEIRPELVACAVEHGVRHLVLLSSRGIEAMGDERLLAAERTVRESGVDWTIVRADWFDQNFDEGFFQPAVMAGELAMPVGDLRQSFVDAGDIAAVACAALTEAGHAGRTYEATGPRALSFAEAVEIIGRAAGLTIAFEGSAERYREAQTAFGFPPEQTEAEVAAFDGLVASGDAEPSGDVERLAGRPPKSFEAYAAHAAAQGAWRRR